MAGKSKPRREEELVVRIPETERLAAADIKPRRLKRMVKEIAGSKKTAFEGARAISGVAVKGGVGEVAKLANIQSPGGPFDPYPPTWLLTIWRRFC